MLVLALTCHFILDVKSTNPPIVSENNRGINFWVSSRWNVADARLCRRIRNIEKGSGRRP